MNRLTAKNIIEEVSKESYGNTTIAINMKSGATRATNPDEVSLNKSGDCLTIAGEEGTKWLDVDSIEYIEI